MSKAVAKHRESPEGRAEQPEIRAAVASLSETPARSAEKPPPAELSPRSQARWRDLHASHHFAMHEDYLLESYLTWDDVATALRRETKALHGRERDRKFKASEDAALTALCYLRGLRFIDPSRPPRPPGRPPGRRLPAPVSSLTIGGGGHADGAR